MNSSAGIAPAVVEKLMLAQSGVALADSADAARCYPYLWRTPAAARQAFHRARSVTAQGGAPGDGECHALLPRATYQRAGAGMRPVSLAFDPTVVPPDGLRAWLEERVGPLARFEVDPQPLAPSGEGAGPDADPTPPVEPAKAPPEAVSGPGGCDALPEAVEAPPGPSVAPQASIGAEPAAGGSAPELQAVQLLHQRLRLAALVQRLRDARPKRTHDVRALDWAAMEGAARAVAELPTAAWRTWRGAAGSEGVVPPHDAGSAVVDGVHR